MRQYLQRKIHSKRSSISKPEPTSMTRTRTKGHLVAFEEQEQLLEGLQVSLIYLIKNQKEYFPHNTNFRIERILPSD